MADSSRTKRRRLTLLGSAAAALALSVSLAPGAVAGPPDSSPGASHASAGATNGRPVDVMTRNLYLGADLGPIIGALMTPPSATEPLLVPNAARATWDAVIATHPEERMSAIADEITDEMPALVGLQEVTLWTTYDYSLATEEVTSDGTEVYDFLELLMHELEENGADYEVVEHATATNFTSPPIPYTNLAVPPFVTKAVQLIDRDVILARDDVDVLAATSRNFVDPAIVKFPLPNPDGATLLPVARGWGSADVEVNGHEFRFVNAHLEAFAIPDETDPSLDTAEAIRVLQAQQLLDATYTEDLPLVYVGDYNSTAPTGDAYQLLTTDLEDSVRGRSVRGQATCCQNATLTNMGSELDKRIDLVLTSDDIKATRVVRTGTSPVDLPGDTRWASDHAGVVARLMFTG